MHLMKFLPALLALTLVSCATTSTKLEKPYDFCTCGPTISADGEPHCAIWGENKNPAQGNKVWASAPRRDCEASDCGQLFSRSCQKIQMSALRRPTPTAGTDLCYCDAVLLENDRGQVQLYCAAWVENGKNLIEYYALDNCSLQRCGQAPFVLAPQFCKGGFRSFYPPLLNRR